MSALLPTIEKKLTEIDSKALIAHPASLLGLIKENKALFAGITMLIWGWIAIYAFTAYHPKFVSHSLVLIKDSALTDRYVVPDQGYAVSTTSSNASNPVLNTMGLLKAQSISDELYHYFQTKHPEVLKQLKIKDQAEWEAFYAEGKAFVKSKNEPGTDMISLQLTWDNPKIAKEALVVVQSAFQKASLELNRAEQTNRRNYLNEQVLVLEHKLARVRAHKSKFKSEMQIATLTSQGDELATTGIELANNLADVQANAQGKEAEYKRYQNMLGMSSEQALEAVSMGRNETLNKLEDKQYELSQSYAFLKTSLTEKNPKLKEVRSQLAQVEDNIKSELKRTLGKTSGSGKNLAVSDPNRALLINQMVAAQGEYIRLDAQQKVLSQRINQVDKQVEALPNVEENLSSIEDEEKSLSNSLNALRQKELEASLKQAETLSNVFVVNTPNLPEKPAFPGRAALALLGLFVGMATASAALVAKNQAKNAGLEGVDFSPINTLPDAIAGSDAKPIGLSQLNNQSKPLQLVDVPIKKSPWDITEPDVMPIEKEPDVFLQTMFEQHAETLEEKLATKQTKHLKMRLYQSLITYQDTDLTADDLLPKTQRDSESA